MDESEGNFPSSSPSSSRSSSTSEDTDPPLRSSPSAHSRSWKPSSSKTDSDSAGKSGRKTAQSGLVHMMRQHSLIHSPKRTPSSSSIDQPLKRFSDQSSSESSLASPLSSPPSSPGPSPPPAPPSSPSDSLPNSPRLSLAASVNEQDKTTDNELLPLPPPSPHPLLDRPTKNQLEERMKNNLLARRRRNAYRELTLPFNELTKDMLKNIPPLSISLIPSNLVCNHDECVGAGGCKKVQTQNEHERQEEPLPNVDFSSNDFLSLANSKMLREEFLAELNRRVVSTPSRSTTDYPSPPPPSEAYFPLSSTGSRLLDGNSMYATELESEIARFHNAESGLLANSGYNANSAVFSTIPTPSDVIVIDSLIHASVLEGIRLSRCSSPIIKFNHNDPFHLRKVLEDIYNENEPIRTGKGAVFIAIEGLYSMDGDVAPLSEIVRCVEQALPAGNGHIIIDEAHSTGVLGPKGAGLVCDLQLESKMFIGMHTFGKALGATGAIILSSPLVRAYLINYARGMIYTTFMPFPSLAAIKAAYRLLQTGKTQTLQRRLAALRMYLHSRLVQAFPSGLPTSVTELITDSDMTAQSSLTSMIKISQSSLRSPIMAIHTGDPRSLAAYCQAAGVMVRAIFPPTVPKGTQRVRVCLHAGNGVQDIDRLIGLVQRWVLDQEQRDWHKKKQRVWERQKWQHQRRMLKLNDNSKKQQKVCPGVDLVVESRMEKLQDQQDQDYDRQHQRQETATEEAKDTTDAPEKMVDNADPAMEPRHGGLNFGAGPGPKREQFFSLNSSTSQPSRSFSFSSSKMSESHHSLPKL